MADIIAVGKLAMAAQLYFWQRRRYALARSLPVGVIVPDDQIRLPFAKFFAPTARRPPRGLKRGPKLSKRHAFTLTGVQEGGGGTT